MSMPLSLCCLHRKLHLTSISVKETGASGSCPTTIQHPPRLPYSAIPPILYSPQSPFSDPPHLAVPSFLLAVNLWLNAPPFSFTYPPVMLHVIFFCSFSERFTYSLLNRPHAHTQQSELIQNAEKKGCEYCRFHRESTPPNAMLCCFQPFICLS